MLLRRYAAAGRIMETDEGVAALEPCSLCARNGHECKVYKNRTQRTCAYCRRAGKPSCNATVPVFERPGSPKVNSIAGLRAQLQKSLTEVKGLLSATASSVELAELRARLDRKQPENARQVSSANDVAELRHE